MSDWRPRRKLVAILSADVKGYSRLMGDDEAATVLTLTTYRQIFSESVSRHHGRVVDSPGDNILAEFASVVDAVQAAVDVQADLGRKNENLPEHRRMDFRIGINVGDVIGEEGRLYGDGVNIAARIEGLADPGGICLSAGAYEQVKSKLEVEGKYLGQFDVKNIAEPVRVWALLTDATALARIRAKRARQVKSRRVGLAITAAVIVAVASVSLWNKISRPVPAEVKVAASPHRDRPLLPIPEDQPSIAVLPFDNLTGSPNQDYLGDGLAEQIITALAKIPGIIAVARNSSFNYRGTAVDIPRTAGELGVRHILAGSVQQSGSQVRVTTQLIDGPTGRQVWAEKYDREIKDLFEVQDEITLRVAIELAVELLESEQARISHRSTNNLDAWGHAMRGSGFFERYTAVDNARAREEFEAAVRVDPGYSWALSMLGWTHWIDARFGFSESRDHSFAVAVELAQRALELDDHEPEAHALQGCVHLYRQEYEAAIEEAEKAISMAPGSASYHALLGMIMKFAGEYEGAISHTKTAMRLQPHYPTWYLFNVASPSFYLHRYNEAITYFEQLMERQKDTGGPHLMWALILLAGSYAQAGQVPRAQETLRQLDDIIAFASIGKIKMLADQEGFVKDPATLEPLFDGLRRAGLPER